MSELTVLALLWCCLTLLLAGIVKGVLGIGLPVISIPLLALVLQVPQAVALLPIPILVSNVWQAFYGGYFFTSLRRFWALILALIAGTAVGVKVLATVDQQVLFGLIGVIVILFSLTNYLQPQLHLPKRGELSVGIIVGFVGGVLGGLSTIFGPPLIMFLIALRLSKDEFVGTIATLYLTGAVPLLIALGAFDVMGLKELLWSALATVPLFLGVLLGQLLRNRLNQEVFRKGLLAMLVIAGIALVRRAFVWTD
ncbi:MAG: sulfite exporter TauE/SafE family protein [Acidiferrobacterales bacterium]